MNYELIYKVRKARLNTNTRTNLRTMYSNEAIAKADKIHQEYLDWLEKHIGHSDFEVTNIFCSADGVAGHVFVGDGYGTQKGLGRRKCLFCGCDDFDDL